MTPSFPGADNFLKGFVPASALDRGLTMPRIAVSITPGLPLPALVRTCQIIGTGCKLPARSVHNDDFPPSLGTSDEWIRSRTGIRERRIAGPGETSFTLGVEAARRALVNSRQVGTDLDLIIFATATPDTMVPSNACRVQAALGCRSIGAFDVSGACTGFLQAITIARQFIAARSSDKILVIGAEVLSRAIDYNDRESCILFGDGAGAVVLGGCEEKERGFRWSRLYSDGGKCELITMPSHVTLRGPPRFDGTGHEKLPGSEYVRIKGREVFKFAVRTLVSLIQDALAACPGIPLDRLWLVPHQVNQRIIDVALAEVAIPIERVFINLDRYGNTSAASVPIALDEIMRSGKVGAGDHLLLVAFGGGMTAGGAMVSL